LGYGYGHKPIQPYLIARRKGNAPMQGTNMRFRSKSKADREAKEWNKAYEGTDIKFFVRKAD
jgi:hypothetical protein